MLIYKLNTDKTVSPLYTEPLTAGSIGSDELVILTPFTSRINCKISYYDPVEDEVVGIFNALNIAKNSVYWQEQTQTGDEGLAFVHKIPQEITEKSATLRFSFLFTSADGKKLSTGIQSVEVRPSTWEIETGPNPDVVIDNRYWPVMTTEQLGVAKVDGETMTISQDGILSLIRNDMTFSNKPRYNSHTLKNIQVGTDSWNIDAVSNGDFETTLENYYTKEEMDTKLEDVKEKVYDITSSDMYDNFTTVGVYKVRETFIPGPPVYIGTLFVDSNGPGQTLRQTLSGRNNYKSREKTPGGSWTQWKTYYYAVDGKTPIDYSKTYEVGSIVHSSNYDGSHGDSYIATGQSIWGSSANWLPIGKTLVSLKTDKANKSTTLAGYGIADAYTKDEIDGKLTSKMTYKGTFGRPSMLPMTGNSVGDFYNILEDDSNYAWNGKKWDKVGGSFTLTAEALAPLLQGDDTITVDLMEDNRKVEIHLDQLFKDTLATKDFLSKNYNAKHTYIGDIYDNAFYQWCLNTPGVETGDMFVVETKTSVPTAKVAAGFPGLEANSVVYGWFYLGQLDNPIILLTERGMYKITDGTSELSCEKIGHEEKVVIKAPETATQGNLTADQLSTLQQNDLNYIIFNNEIYSLMDKTHTSDTLTYSHVGYENAKHQVKTISITMSTRAWTLNKSEIGGGGSGGGTAIGDGHKLTTNSNSWFGDYYALGVSTTVHNLTSDGGMVETIPKTYGWHRVKIMGYYEQVIDNCSIVMIKDFSVVINITPQSLYAFDGTEITTSNLDQYTGKLLYLTNDCSIEFEE